LVFVNDMIMAGDDETKKLALKQNLAVQFEMKNLGNILNISIVIRK